MHRIKLRGSGAPDSSILSVERPGTNQPFFSHPIHHIRPSFLSLLVVTQIRGYIAGSSPPLPTTVRALHFYREKISVLPSSTRVELCLPTLGALIPVTMETRCFHKKLEFQRYPPKDICTARYERKSSKKKFQTFQKPRKK